MFPSLAAAIDELDPPVDGYSLGEVLRLRDCLDAKVAVGVGQFDRDGLWALDDASSATAWLRQHAGLSGSAAASLARTGKVVLGAPVLAAPWLDGAVSGGQVQAVVANVNDRVAGLFADHETDLVPRLAALNVRETAIVMQAWRDRADALLDDEDERREPRRSLHVSRTLDGRAELKGSFDAEAAAPIEAALRVAATDDVDGEKRSPAERRADALRDVCQWFLDHQDTATTAGRHRPHVNVVMTNRRARSPLGWPHPRRHPPRPRRHPRVVVRRQRPPSAHRRAGRHPRLRPLHPHHPAGAVLGVGSPRRALPHGRRLRPAPRMVRRPPRCAMGRRWRHQRAEPRIGVQ